MILADKITELRKKSGWSQEELAAQLHVSRQSVSKWEGAQSMPDLDKIIAMANIFGVSTDYLLKEELEEAVYVPETTEAIRNEEDGTPVRWVSMEEANSFLEVNRRAAQQIATGVMMCILSVIPVTLLACAASAGYVPFTEDQGGIVGVILLFVVIAGAVALFVTAGMRLSRYEFLEKEFTETEYGVAGMVRERKNSYEPTRVRYLVSGILMCVISVIPVLVCALVNEWDDFVMAVGTVLFLLILAVGVRLIVKSSIIWGGYQKLLEEGDYTREEKSKTGDGIMAIYWSVVTAIYLGYSFYTFDWERSWIIWPVAAVLAVAVSELRKKPH